MSQQLSEQELVRRESLTKLRALGINPYPQALYPVNILSKEIKENYEEGRKVIIAGRLMSRTQSHKKYNYKQIIEEIQEKGIVLKSMTRYGVVEEAPEVYKDVDTIANISHDLKMATKVAKLVPIGVIKG